MDDDTVQDDTVQDWSQVPTERVEALLVTWAAREAAVKAEFLAALAVFVQRRAWEGWECVSPSQWLSWKCGLGRVAASEHVRVALALTRLPSVHDALRDGRITWSKVREITRVATPESERSWLDLALAGTAAHVERTVRAFRRVTPAQVEHQHDDRRLWTTVADDGSLVISVKLPTETGAAIVEGLRAGVTPERGVPLAVRLADRFVEAITGGRPITPEVIIHVDAPVLDGQEGVCATAGGYAVAPEAALQACCNGVVQWVVHQGREVVGMTGRRRFASAVQRRAIEARSQVCDVLGCDDDAPGFDVHHVHHRGHGGPTELGNLRRVCRRHHRLIHLHRLRAVETDDGRLRLCRPDGTPLDHPIRRLAMAEPTPTGSPIPAWTGEPLDLDLALWCLFNNPLVSSRKLAAA